MRFVLLLSDMGVETPRGSLTRGFLRGGLPFLASYGIAVGFVFWQVERTTSVPLLYLLVTAGLLGTLLSTLGTSWRDLRAIRETQFPRISHVIHDHLTLQEGKLLILLEPSEILSHSALISYFFVDDGDYERFVGVGKVIHIQENGKIQAEIINWLKPDLLKRLQENDVTVLRRLIVKPSIPYEYAGLLLRNREVNDERHE